MSDKKKLLQDCMDRAVAAKETAGVSYIFLQDGKEESFGCSGFADIEKGTKMDRDTIVHLYSQSKPITGAAAMTLVQDGFIDLYEPVGKYIKSFANQTFLANGKVLPVPSDRPVLIKDLLNMTSGLVYPGEDSLAQVRTGYLMDEMIDKLHGDPANMVSTMEFAERLGEIPLNFAPGMHFQYGTSADVLGAVIEKVSGMKFSEYLQEKFFDPLDMKDTAFFVPEEKKSRLARPYIVKDGTLTPYYGDNLAIRNDGGVNAFESGGAGLFSTLDDYSHFAAMLMNGGTYNGKEILRPEAVKFFGTGQLTDYQQKDLEYWNGLEGYSYNNLMRVMVEPSKAGVIGNKGEYGWDGWLGTFFMNDPVSKISFIMFTQITDYGTGHITRKLRNIVMS